MSRFHQSTREKIVSARLRYTLSIFISLQEKWSLTRRFSLPHSFVRSVRSLRLFGATWRNKLLLVCCCLKPLLSRALECARKEKQFDFIRSTAMVSIESEEQPASIINRIKNRKYWIVREKKNRGLLNRVTDEFSTLCSEVWGEAQRENCVESIRRKSVEAECEVWLHSSTDLSLPTTSSLTQTASAREKLSVSSGKYKIYVTGKVNHISHEIQYIEKKDREKKVKNRPHIRESSQVKNKTAQRADQSNYQFAVKSISFGVEWKFFSFFFHLLSTLFAH